MIAAEPQPDLRGAAAVDGAAARAALLDAATAWSAKARLEAFPRDRLWVRAGCGACGRAIDRVFCYGNSPWTGGDGGPLYRELGDLPAILDDALRGRPAHVDREQWRLALDCGCGAPAHHRRAHGAALLHAVLGSGAGLVVSNVEPEGGATFLRAADGGASLVPFDGTPEGFRAAFGVPFSPLDAWEELARDLPARAGTVFGATAEPGVSWLGAVSEAELSAGIAAHLGRAPRIVVRLDPSTVDGPGWPSRLRVVARSIEEGAAVAMVVERDVLLAQARAWARARLGADLREDAGRCVLRSERGDWPISPERVALSMVRYGRTLAEACAAELSEARDSLDDRIATLATLTELVPGSSFEVEGTSARARLADGRDGQTLELTEIPPGTGALSRDVLAREAAFFFDVAPPWADRTRVCSCGAAARLERRLVAWPWRGDDGRRPWVVGLWGDEREPRAAEVVAIVCDRHATLPAEVELRSSGLGEGELARRLDADLASSGLGVRASVWVGPEDRRVLVARGPLAAGVMLSAGRVRALDDALGGVVGAGPALCFAVGADVLAVTAPCADADALVARALEDTGVVGPAPFWVRCELDLDVPPLGSFDVVVERR